MRSCVALLQLAFIFVGCSTYSKIPESQVNNVLDSWHQAAAEAQYDTYFNLMSNDAVFIGTDATENWQLAEFKRFAKPYFDAGKAWSFTMLERNVYSTNGVTYFDELLDTQMGICRGSGIIKEQNGKPVIAHYVLSIAVPNENVTSLTEMKKNWDDSYMKELRTN
ncbi:SnoaL-like domain-containing protein [Nonlabens sp. Hel1_33_55]|uniref:nuclear transport factor 2 family protein n=1 Tax=Nonlabens sp. Hel1_33_55 TaxID=1336802 RepID=UPI000875BC90|nr:nuclear transport factor 2 family protein [Nonlabens sp. Hel1_33_55]SCY37103.1 SnoaL-like domain-containing protein [Nonlabens sp. Hel1_33_55]